MILNSVTDFSIQAVPVIAISSYCRPDSVSGQFLGLPAVYVDAVLEAGALPFMLPPTKQFEILAALRENIDGLLLSGGPDLPAASYGMKPHPAMQCLHPRRSNWDLKLASEILAWEELPVLAICLGMQEINVAAGGSLYRHLPDDLPGSGLHTRPNQLEEIRHKISIEPDSRLGKLIDKLEIDVNTSHHQAIRDLGNDLRAVAWSLQDQVIEAIELKPDKQKKRFFLGVQWHPERIRKEQEQKKIFRKFVQAATQRHSARIK